MARSTGLRVDAAERRARILQVAANAFVTHGLDVPMERIAREAGVGVATLYRRFPDREALLLAVVTGGLTRIRDELRSALDTHESAWAALAAAVRSPDQTGIGLRSRLAQSSEVGAGIAAHPEVHRLQREAVEALQAIIESAQREGSLRTDIGAGDVVLLLYALARQSLPDHAPEGAAGRLSGLLLAAVATRPHLPLPGAPLRIEDIWPKAPAPREAGGSPGVAVAADTPQG